MNREREREGGVSGVSRGEERRGEPADDLVDLLKAKPEAFTPPMGAATNERSGGKGSHSEREIQYLLFVKISDQLVRSAASAHAGRIESKMTMNHLAGWSARLPLQFGREHSNKLELQQRASKSCHVRASPLECAYHCHMNP